MICGGGGGGGGIHTNSFAMIMFCVFVGAVYMHLARCRLFMTVLIMISYQVGVKVFYPFSVPSHIF